MNIPEAEINVAKDLKGHFKFAAYKYLGLTDKPDYLSKNMLAAFLVLLPEIPTYFIPAFSEAKANGNAKDVKKGEGYRGLLTGGLEGLAVSAIIAKGQFRKANIIPLVIFGSLMQFVSSKLFPIIGEKVGQFLYTGKEKNEHTKLDIISRDPIFYNMSPQFNALKQKNTPTQINTNITKPLTNNANLKV